MTSPTWMDIRRLRYDHPDSAAMIQEVQNYYVSIYGGPDVSPVDHDQFAPPRGAFFVGFVADVPVATGGWRLCSEKIPIAAEKPAEIKRMYVVKAARGQGLARLLLAHLERTAAEAGIDALVLETGHRQPDAIELYRSSGYTEIPHFGHYKSAPLAVHLGKLLTR